MTEQTTNTVQVNVPNNEGIVGTPTVFTFIFSQAVIASNLSVIFNVDEKKVINNPRSIIKPLKAVIGNLKEATAELTFPEALAGATLAISFAIIGIKGVSISSITLKIKRADGLEEIDTVYWSEQELASFGTILPQKREICKNEWAFLHIYTKGMFGYNMFAQVREYDNQTDIRPIKNFNVEMRDNVVSIPYSMASAITDYKTKYSTVFEKECLELYAKAHQDKTKINEGPRSPNLFLHYKKEEKNPAKKTSVPPVKVIIADDEEEPRIPTKARCSLEFRPVSGYKGDYGFDWVRKGDTGAPQPFNDYAFSDYMGKHYATVLGKDIVQTDGNEGGPDFMEDFRSPYADVYLSEILIPNLNQTNINRVTELDKSFEEGRMFDRLRKRFKQLVFPWKNGKQPYETYVPVMTIMNGKTANLVLHLDIKQEPQKIVFEFNNSRASNFLQLSVSELNSNLSVTPTTRKTHLLNITCNGEFNDEYTLKARAFGKNDPKGEICGILRILPNGQMYQHKIKIAFIGITTNINPPRPPVTGKATPSGTEKLKNIFGQALLIPDIDDSPTIDLTGFLLNFKGTFCISNGSGFVIDRSTGTLEQRDQRSEKLKQLLLQRLRDKYHGLYDHYYKVFFFLEDASTDVAGYSRGTKFTVCFKSVLNDDALIVHELLHSLELPHTFDGYSRNTKFTYEYIKTDNLMDYSDIEPPYIIPKSLYHWPWQILNLKIR